MSSSGPRAINCTSCGAGLEVMGGGRVKVQVCEFCGAALDASENFQVLAQFSKAQDLGSPFVPGMSGQIDGIDWTVIGSLQRFETWQGDTTTWFEHQLYSETHGYAWLSVEDGHLVFSRRMRGETSPDFCTWRQVEHAEHRPSMRVMDNWVAYGELDVAPKRRLFKYHESGHYHTDAAAGSFTWLPKVGEVDSSVMFTRDTESLTCTEAQNGEREIMLGRYLPPIEVYDSFGVADTDRPVPGVHILEPYHGWVHERFVKRILAGCAVLSLLLGLFLFVGGKERVGGTNGAITLAQLPAEVQFEAPGDGRLVQLELLAYPENGWSGFGVEVRDPNGAVLGYHEVGIQRYSGRDSDGRWSEGSPKARVTVQPTMAGAHTVEVSYFGTEFWQGGRPQGEPFGVELRADAKRGAARWPLIAAGIFAFLFVAVNLPKAAFQRRRAGLSDWVDEEDDD